MCAVAQGTLMLKYMRRKAESLGIRFVDKVMATELLVNDKGEIAGAVGFGIGEDEIRPYVFQGRSIILAAGPCGYKSAYFGHHNITGDGIAMAYRAGAELMGMEFAVSHNSCPRAFAMAGMGRFVNMGAKFVNAAGEEFMWKYDHVLGNKTTFDKLTPAMASEVKEGRGPVYLDMTSISPEDYELNRKVLWYTNIAMDRMGLDFRRDRIEWIPVLVGNMGSSAGLRISSDMSTTLPRLFAGGDTGGKYHFGAVGSQTGMSFGWCAVSGYRAGESAARVIKEGDSVGLADDAVSEALDYQLAPAHATGGFTPDEVIGAVQDAVIPYNVLILKHAVRLDKALLAVQRMSRGTGSIVATNSHDLMKAHEASNMATIAEITLRASLLREESRGMHYREDFPARDDVNWKKWLYVRNEGGKLWFWVEDEQGVRILTREAGHD